MIVGIPKEVKDNEYRIAATPEGVRELVDVDYAPVPIVPRHAPAIAAKSKARGCCSSRWRRCRRRWRSTTSSSPA